MRLTRKRILTFIGIALLIFAGWFFWQLFGPDPGIVVSRETTFITAPLRPDGLPDYELYILDKMREGVTPENNAAVLIWQAVGPRDMSDEDYRLVAKEIGAQKSLPTEETLHSVRGEETVAQIDAWLVKQAATPQENNQKDQDEIPGRLLELRGESGLNLIDRAIDRAWTSQQIPPLAKWVADNQKALDMIVEASTRSQFYLPATAFFNDSYDSLLMMDIELGICRDVARSLSARAMLHLGEGRYAEAWKDINAIHRLARLDAPRNTLVECLVWIDIERIAAQATFALVSDPNIPLHIAQLVLRELQAFPSRSTIGSSLFEGERIQALDAMLTLRDPEPGSGESHGIMEFIYGSTSFDWNQSLSLVNSWYDEFEPLLQEMNWQESHDSLRSYGERLEGLEARASENWLLKTTLSRSTRARLFSDWVAALFMPAAQAAIFAEVSTNTKAILAQLAAAIAVYRAQHGEYPEKLEALMPDILGNLPLDSFHEIPFSYHRTKNGYLLYSLGPNGNDDAGSSQQLKVFQGYSTDIEPAETLYELLGDELPADFDATDELSDLDTHIPSDADDIAIRVPLPKLELPKAKE